MQTRFSVITVHDPALIEELGIGHARGGTLRLISSLFVDFPCPFGYARMYSWPYDGDSFEIPRTGINRKMPTKAMFGDLARGQSLLRPHPTSRCIRDGVRVQFRGQCARTKEYRRAVRRGDQECGDLIRLGVVPAGDDVRRPRPVTVNDREGRSGVRFYPPAPSDVDCVGPWANANTTDEITTASGARTSRSRAT